MPSNSWWWLTVVLSGRKGQQVWGWFHQLCIDEAKKSWKVNTTATMCEVISWKAHSTLFTVSWLQYPCTSMAGTLPNGSWLIVRRQCWFAAIFSSYKNSQPFPHQRLHSSKKGCSHVVYATFPYNKAGKRDGGSGYACGNSGNVVHS